MIFKKKKKTNDVSVLTEHYVPTALPKHGEALDTFIAGDYRLLSDKFIKDCYQDCEDKLKPLIETCDRFTLGDTFDAFIDGQMAHIEEIHQEDVAHHDLQVKRIRNAHTTRKEALERLIKQSDEKCKRLEREIEPLRNLKAQFELRLGRFHISLGALVTLAALIVDSFTNFNFLESVLYQNMALLILCVVCLAFMSDLSMNILASLINRKDEDFMPKWLFNASCVVLPAFFLLSVVTSVMIRVGTMDISFLVPDAAGVLVSKDTYSMADWGVTIVTSFITASTGIFSLVFSLDKNAHKVAQRRELEKELAAANAAHEELLNEQSDLKNAVDPGIRDQECRQAAAVNMEALRIGLKHLVRGLLILHQQEPEYTTAMAESAKEVLSANANDTGCAPGAAA